MRVLEVIIYLRIFYFQNIDAIIINPTQAKVNADRGEITDLYPHFRQSVKSALSFLCIFSYEKMKYIKLRAKGGARGFALFRQDKKKDPPVTVVVAGGRLIPRASLSVSSKNS